MARRRGTSPFLRNAALYRGVLGGSKPWTAVFVLLTLGRVRRAVFGRTAVTVATERLEPGQSVGITALPPPPRRERRR